MYHRYNSIASAVTKDEDGYVHIYMENEAFLYIDLMYRHVWQQFDVTLIW